MLDQLLDALVQSKNEAADDLLLEAMALGTEAEKSVALGALMRRGTTHGLGGVVGIFEELPESIQNEILKNIRTFHHAIRECGRSEIQSRRQAAMMLIALGRQGKLAYVLSENLHHEDEALSRSAIESLVALARWVSVESRRLQAQGPAADETAADAGESAAGPSPAAQSIYKQLMDQRPEIEQAVARAIDVHRGRHSADLLRAALLLCDWRGSKTLAILQSSKHGGQGPMMRRLQQRPDSEHVEAFLLAAAHGGLRAQFALVFSHIDEAPVLDAMLRRTYWLKDHQLQASLHHVTRGLWWSEPDLLRDLERRDAANASLIGEWIAVSGMHDITQDERLDKLRLHAKDDFAARLRLLRIAFRRKRGSSVTLIRNFLNDPDERIARMATREIVRRRPQDYENVLLQQMTTAGESVRRVIARSVGQSGFDQFWQRFDRLDRNTRKQAGKAMLKLLPDGIPRLGRRLLNGPLEHRIKAMQMTSELELAEPLRNVLLQLCQDPNAKLRSKAVAVIGTIKSVEPDVLIERLLQDTDARVRANTIEVLEAKQRTQFLPILAQRARAANNRERANAIKAMQRMKVSNATKELSTMLHDARPEHRISALWALRQIGWWQLLTDVGKLAKEDPNIRVRRYALGILRGVAEMIRAEKVG